MNGKRFYIFFHQPLSQLPNGRIKTVDKPKKGFCVFSTDQLKDEVLQKTNVAFIVVSGSTT